jgi:hypothetical protein
MLKPATLMKLMYDEIESIGKAMNYNTLEPIDLSMITNQCVNLQKELQKTIIPTFNDLEESSFKKLPEHIQEVLLLLGENGWYLDLEMDLPTLGYLRDVLDEGDIAKAENVFIKYFEDRVSKIEKFLLNKFPHRAHLVKAAFDAHKRKKYCLSIPLFFAQTDGICKDIIRQYLFMKSNGRPRTAIYVDQIAANSLMAALLSPLAETLPINASERERPTNFTGLNRHMVLHGESLDYGNKTNSLKAISLINYVGNVFTINN